MAPPGSPDGAASGPAPAEGAPPAAELPRPERRPVPPLVRAARRLLQPAIDAALIILAFYLAWVARYRLRLFAGVDPAFEAPFEAYIPFAVGAAVMLPALYAAAGVYAPRRGAGWLDQSSRIVNGTLTGLVILLAATFFFRPLVYSRLLLLEATALIIVLLSVERMIGRAIVARVRQRGIGIDRVLIVGAGDVGRAVMRTMVARPDLGYHVIGFLDDDPERGRSTMGRFRGLGPVDGLGPLLAGEHVDEVIVALPWTYYRRILTVLADCERARVRARVVPDILRLSLSRVDIDDLAGIPLIGVKDRVAGPTARLAKRLLDLVVITLGAPALLLLGAIVALAVRLDSPGPIFFRQQRVGLNGRPFTIYKFRSMREGAEAERGQLEALNEADGPLFKIRNDPRITRVGRVIRKLSLDELPQFINVLRGEMSLVGPRPPLAEEVARYQPWQVQRLEVPPGVTGLAQVSGRSDLTFDEVCLLDIYYVEQWSLALDVQILLRTIPHILRGSGAY
jgi:exopolysaccharide biosynthesis polyprenyl glycosylphosphotransferase